MTMTWGTITAVSPLRVTLDGDTVAVPFTPDSLVDPLVLAVSDRVRCDLSGRRLVVVGRAGGDFDPTVQDGLAGRLGSAFVLREIVYFTSSGTFSKASYPWLKAMRVRVLGGGGGGGGAATTSSAQNAIAGSGAAGGYAESFLTNIAALASSVAVTVGAGGSGGAAGANAGGAGGASSFGSLVAADGGGAGGAGTAFASGSIGAAQGVAGGVATAAELQIPGQGSSVALYSFAGIVVPARPGVAAFFGSLAQQLATVSGAAGSAGKGYGSGGQGGHNAQSQGTSRAGGAGSSGIVALELYA